MLKILVADSHTLLRQSLKVLVETSFPDCIINECGTSDEMMSKLSINESTDLLIATLEEKTLPQIQLAKQNHPCMKIIGLSDGEGLPVIHECLRANLSGYLLRSSDAEELRYAISRVMDGKSYLCAEIGAHIVGQLLQHPLASGIFHRLNITSREMEILSLIANGNSNQEVAEMIFLIKRTVEGHRKNLMEKLDSRNSA